MIEIPISDDPLVEETERFFGRIISGGGIPNLDIFAPNAIVHITDNNECYSKSKIYYGPSTA